MNIQGNLGDYENVAKPAIRSDPTAYFEIFDFKIPVTSDGRRIWSPKFKKHVTQKLASGEMTTAQIARQCDVKKTVVYQWKQEVEKNQTQKIVVDTTDQPFEVFGFKVPMTNDGRRLWPLELKRLVVDKLVAGEMKAKALARACDVDSSMIYQWKMEVEGKSPKPKLAEPDEPQFAEVHLTEEPTPVSNIIIRKGDVVLELPIDYPENSIATIMSAL